MAAARDQAARILRPEPNGAEGSHDATVAADRPGSPGLEESVPRRIAEAPANPAVAKPATASAATAAPKSGKRKLFLMGVVALLALAGLPFVARIGRTHARRLGVSLGFVVLGVATWLAGLLLANVRVICGLGYL